MGDLSFLPFSPSMRGFRDALQRGNVIDALCLYAPFGWTSRQTGTLLHPRFEFRVDTGYHKGKSAHGETLLVAVRHAFQESPDAR